MSHAACSLPKVPCALNCGKIGFISKSSLEFHLSNQCALTKIRCSLCDFEFFRHELDEHDCIEILKQRLQNYAESLAFLEYTIEENEVKIASQEGSIISKESTIATQINGLAEKDKTIAEKNKAITK